MEHRHDRTPLSAFDRDALGVHGHFQGSLEDAPEHEYEEEGDEVSGHAEQGAGRQYPIMPVRSRRRLPRRGTRYPAADMARIDPTGAPRSATPSSPRPMPRCAFTWGMWATHEAKSIP